MDCPRFFESDVIVFIFLDCSANVTLFKNGFCNDEVNHIDCGFDGGECCVKPKGTDLVNKITIYIIMIRVHAYSAVIGFPTSFGYT